MVHPYPRRCASFPYIGRATYLLTFPTHERLPRFADPRVVQIVHLQIVRAATEKAFEVIAYCFMPDHLHLVAEGLSAEADCREFIKLAKQYSGYSYSRAHNRERLWQRYSHDNIARDLAEVVRMVRYVVANPVEGGLVSKPEDYPFLGSQRWSTEDLLEWCRAPSEIVREAAR